MVVPSKPGQSTSSSAGVLADADDDDAEEDEEGNPEEADSETPVDFGALYAPSSGEDVAQRLDGVRLRQDVREVAQEHRHSLHGPHDTTDQQVRVEATERQVDGARFFIAQAGNEQTCNRQQETEISCESKFKNLTISSKITVAHSAQSL